MTGMASTFRLLLVLAIASTTYGQMMRDYCSLTPEHTMCEIGPACGSSMPVTGVSDEDINNILYNLNWYRDWVAGGQEVRGNPGPQPPAANMLEIVWDDELAAIAQKLAYQCVYEYDCYECRRVVRFDVQQNIYQTFVSDPDQPWDWLNALRSWYDQVDQMPESEVDPFTLTDIVGDYSTMLWANTGRIGCGFAKYEDPENSGGVYHLHVCNFGPAGNIPGEPMYMIGDSCSACPAGTSCSTAYANLCIDDWYQNMAV